MVFLDTETTSLDRRHRRIWDIAAVRRELDGSEIVYGAYVGDVDLTHAEPKALDVGRFHERHPQHGGSDARPVPPAGIPVYRRLGWEPGCAQPLLPEPTIAADLARLTAGAQLVGVNPSFDEETLAAMLDRHGQEPAWHYHLIDVPCLAAGWLGAPPPQSSRELSLRCGVDPAYWDQHTALGDAMWVKAWYDAVMVHRSYQDWRWRRG